MQNQNILKQAGRECGSGSWQPVCLPNCPAATSHGETLGHCASPRPTDSARPAAKVQTWHLSLAYLSAWYCHPGALARALQRSWPAPSSLPCHGAASLCQLDFGLSKAFWSRGCSFVFLRTLQFFYFITQHPGSPMPPVPLPDKLILLYPFFNRKTGA